MSAGPSRPRVVTLTADQLLGSSLTPARPHKQHKNSNAPRVLTIEDLLGPGLTVARPPSRPPSRPPPRPSPSRTHTPSSTRSAPNPRLVRVTADEVLRTGIPVRTLQAVKARSGQAQVLTPEELLASSSSSASRRGTRGRAISAQPAAGPSSVSSSASGSGSSRGGAGTANAGSHVSRPDARQAHRADDAANGSTQNRNPRGQARRSNSLGSTRTLPMYTQEPGDSEVVIDRGATELEDDDEIPITVMPPVEENEPNADHTPTAGPTSSPPGSPSQTEGGTLSRQLSPIDPAIPVASSLPNDCPLPPWTSIYADAAPSYEAAMSTPNLHAHFQPPGDVPPVPALPIPSSTVPSATPVQSSPTSSPSPPASTSPRPVVRVVTPQAPVATHTPPASRSSASPSSSPGERSDGADTPRRRFGFMSLFHSRSSSRLRSRSHSHSHSSTQAPSSPNLHARSGSNSAVPSPRRVASPELLSPAPTRPFHRMSQSASGSMLDLASRSRAGN